MEHQNNGYARPEDLANLWEEDVETSVGKVRIRRLAIADLLQARGALIDIAAMATAREDSTDAAPAPKVAADQVQAMVRIVQKGVILPKLAQDREAGPTADVFPADDVVLLFTRIMALSGASRKAGQDLVPS